MQSSVINSLKNGNLNFEPHKETEHPIKVVMSDTSCFAQYKEEVMDLLKRMSMVSVGTMEVVRGWRMHSASWRWQGHISAHEHRVRLQDAAHTAQDQLADHLPRTLLQTDSQAARSGSRLGQVCKRYVGDDDPVLDGRDGDLSKQG